jgi:hypothetical protein
MPRLPAGDILDELDRIRRDHSRAAPNAVK